MAKPSSPVSSPFVGHHSVSNANEAKGFMKKYFGFKAKQKKESKKESSDINKSVSVDNEIPNYNLVSNDRLITDS